ncbi:MAG: hypothetical protein IJJ34_10885 [Clostridia bacterium]|nr:hypothetical protein [Clostridia bacterium]
MKKLNKTLKKKKNKKNALIKAQAASCYCITPHDCKYYCNIAGSGYISLYSNNYDGDARVNS